MVETVGADITCQRANVADQSKSWEQISLCDTNLRRLGRSLELRAPDIGAAAEQIRGNTDNHLLRTCGNIVGAGEQIIHRAWRHAEQHTERIFCLRELYVQLRNRRFSSTQDILRLINIASCDSSVLELYCGEPQRDALARDVVTRDGDLPFGSPNL